MAVALAACGDNLEGVENGAPQVGSLQLTTAEDTPGSGTLSVTDAEGDDVTITLGTPMHGSITQSGSMVTYTPAANYNGSDSVMVSVSDGTLEATATIMITITAVNDAPTAVADAFATGEDVPLEVEFTALLANDTDIDSDTLTVSVVDMPVNGTVAIVGTDAVFRPTANFNGTASFRYTISDGSLTSTAMVTVTVGGANDAPVAVDDAATTPEDTALVISGATLVANDTDAENQTLTVTGVANLTNGTVAIAGSTITFTPTANFNGTATFRYTVSDGAATDTGVVTVTVTAVNDAPVAVDDAATTPEDTAITLISATLTANDTDVDAGQTLVVTAASNPVDGTVSTDANGAVTFTPTANFNGMASFQYLVSDGNGGSSPGLVTVTVTAVNDPPVAVDDTASAGSGVATNYATSQLLANDIDIDGGAPSITAVANPSNGTVSLNGTGDTITYQSGATFVGTATFDYTVSDGNGGTDTGSVSVTVVPVPVCGDGLVTGAEACDDSGSIPNDGCSATCTVESGFACAGQPSICTPTCGDGFIVGTEACDDGPGVPPSGDGCSAQCAVEPGFECVGQPSVCTTVCGDGIETPNEQCDDGNTDNTDGCTNDCVVGVICHAIAVAGGDRFAVDPQTGHCYASFDSASTTFAAAELACEAIGGHLATITSSGENEVVASVQNSAQNPWIGAVDDANDTDTIFAWITGEAFGFANFAPNEPDDDVNFGGTGECLNLATTLGQWGDTNCTIATFVIGRICEVEVAPCGDNVVQASLGEQCEDGNTTSGDGCSATCRFEGCGDGVIGAGETCDDSNRTNGDDCSAICEAETLFFSEYVEGTEFNKALEIRNPSSTAAFNLVTNSCGLRIYVNGSATASAPLMLTGTIQPNDVFVVCDNTASAGVLLLCDQLSNGAVMNFNGDDAIDLVCGTAVLDVIGQIGVDPGTEWGTGLTSMAANTLRRKCPLRNGDVVGSDVFDPAVEWDGFANDTFSGLGVAECVP